MPNKKKKLFNKNNSVTYLLLPGNANAVNADGKSLSTEFIPVSKGCKQGSSFLLPKLNALSEAPSEGPSKKHNHQSQKKVLAKILESIEDGFSGDPDQNSLAFKSVSEDLFDQDCPCDESVFEKIWESLEDDYSDDPNENSLMLKSNNMGFSSENKRFKDLQNMGHAVESVEYEDDTDDLSGCSVVSDQFFDADEFDHTQSKYLFSSVTPNCPESIKIFNERFEKAFEEYDDDQIGALDDEEICGHLTTECDRVKDLINPLGKEEEIITLGNYDSSIKDHILQYVEKDEEENFVKIVTEIPTEFDCESILSTYSNKYNHPTVIKVEHDIKKIKVPTNPLKKKLTRGQLKHLDKECEDENSESEESEDNCSVSTSFNMRLKGETPEQRRERKNLFKEAKRESRMFKKENKMAFKNERKIQKAQVMNSRQNKGIKLL